MESNKYTIQEVNSDGNLVVKFDCDSSVQTLVDAPTDNKENLEAFMAEYLRAYKAGKEVEKQSVDPAVKAMFNKVQTVQEG